MKKEFLYMLSINNLNQSGYLKTRGGFRRNFDMTLLKILCWSFLIHLGWSVLKEIFLKIRF